MEENGGLDGRFYTMGEIERATGVPAATIRAWERRYGVPVPGRSSGRHRLYSEQDLALLRWLIARQQEGMNISRAVALWQHQASRAVVQSAESIPAGTPVRLGLADLRAAWIDSCLRYDRRSAQSIVSQAFAIHPAQDVCVEVLLRGLSEIGDAWFRGEASVQQEHFASAVAMNQIERLIAAASPWRRERVLLACPPGEYHSFGLLFLALLLRQRGLDTVFLGASVPVERIDEAVKEIKPAFAVLSAQRVPDAAALIEMAAELDRLGVPVGYGGLIFNLWPGLRERVPAHFLGETVQGAPEAIEGLLSELPSTSMPSPVPSSNEQAAQCYLQALRLIEASVQASVRGGLPEATALEAGNTVAAHVVAGLKIGDLSPLNAGRPWLEACFRGCPDPEEATRSFLVAYRDAARRHMSGCVGPVLDWLDEAAQG